MQKWHRTPRTADPLGRLDGFGVSPNLGLLTALGFLPALGLLNRDAAVDNLELENGFNLLLETSAVTPEYIRLEI